MLRAFDAFRAGDPVKLQKAAAQVKSGHVLEPWLEYWRLRLRLEDAALDPEVRAFIRAEEKSYLADRLRGEWLKELGRRGDWQAFELERAPLVQDDLEIRCYGWLARLARGDESVYEESRVILSEPRELPGGRVAYRFRLRPDLLFAEDPAFALSGNEGTREVVAADVAFELMRIADPAVTSPIFETLVKIEGFRAFSERLGALRAQVGNRR